MKTRILAIAFLLLSASFIAEAKPAPDIDVNFGFFYQSLSPHGSWLQIDAGVYGWRPNRIGRDWRPYSDGRWTWTEYGWYWDSYEPFGWATYHYGRWLNDDYYGWIWIPDYEWGPSWVEWRYDNDYIGWAPLPPYAGFRVGFGIHFSIGWHSPYSYWNFVRFDHFCHSRVHNYFVDSYRVNRFFSHTKYRTNYYDRNNRIYNGGVDRDFIERRGGERIRETSIRRTSDLRDVSRNSYSRSYVREFRPNEDDLRRTRDIEINKFERPERNISIERDKIAIRTSRDNGMITGRNDNNNSERPVVRSERIERANDNSGRTINRNEYENRSREIERARDYRENSSQQNNRAYERNESVIPERNVIRENTSKREQPRQRTEIYNNRSSERSAERSVTRENRSSERKVESRSSSRSSERSAPPARSGSSNSGSRERKR